MSSPGAELHAEVFASMVIIDGGPDAALPPGSGGPVVAGPEAVFVAGRVDCDASTLVRIGQPGEEGDLVMAYRGEIATPHHRLRVVSVDGEVFGEVAVPSAATHVSIYLTDLEEPDGIFVSLDEPEPAVVMRTADVQN